MPSYDMMPVYKSDLDQLTRVDTATVDMYRISLRARYGLAAGGDDVLAQVQSIDDAWDTIGPHCRALGFEVCR